MANTGALVITVVLIIFIIVLAIIAFVIMNNRKKCENSESPFCYTALCPPGYVNPAPCYGFGERQDSQGNTVCSAAGFTTVQANLGPST